MAGYRSDEDGATNNGFGRRSMHQWEGRLLYAAGYMAPPDFRAPGGWRLSAGGILIPQPPTGAALDAAIDEVIETMSDEQRADPCFYPDNREAWTAFFRRRYERELAAYDGPSPSPARNNAAGRRRWWSAPGRMLGFVLEHIERGNDPVLEMPPPPRPTLSRRCGSSWMPRCMASGSSGSVSFGSATRSASQSSASTPRTVKQEPASTHRRNIGALVIREGARTVSLPRRRKPRKDAAAKAASDLAEAKTASAEEAATAEAIARSLRDVVPAENTMPLDAALEWSRWEWEREEAEQQRRLLDLAAAERRAAAAALPRCGAPVVKLEESSDDELYRPMPPRFGDAGQGSSRQAPPPQVDSDSSSDDGGDYTRFYRHFGMWNTCFSLGFGQIRIYYEFGQYM
jgi:hypothetical protein